MGSNEALVELRFSPEVKDSVPTAVSSLGALDVEVNESARDPSIATALTIAAAVTTLAIELVKLAKELRSKGKKQGILLVRLGKDNKETSISLLEASDTEIQEFVSSD